MTVVVLPLCGLTAAEASQAADAMLDIDSGPDKIERLLILDDTALLGAHEGVYESIDTSYRVPREQVMCVLIGPRNGDGGRKLEMPGNLGSTGSPVLWVSRPAGIEWKVERSAVANRHPGPPVAAMDDHPLVRLLRVDEMFDRVRQTFTQVPGGVASPGLWLAGAEDESATFAGALSVAIKRASESRGATEDPFNELTPAQAGGAVLSQNGPIAGYLSRIATMDSEATHALSGMGFAGKFKRGDHGPQRYVSRVGVELDGLRDLIARALQDGTTSAGAGLTPGQADRLRSTGIEFAARGTGADASQQGVAAAEQSLIFRTVARAIRGGDTISHVTRRLTATERAITRVGSDKYLPEVANRCPPGLLGRLADPPQKVPRRADVTEVRQELGLADAEASAKALRDLIIDVANREWSPAGVTPRQLAGTRTALDGSRKALAEFAGGTDAGGAQGGARGARMSRLGESYLPVLHDLVLRVVAAELASPSATGQEALRTANERTAALLREWAGHVQANGVAAQPSFATSGAGAALYVIEDDVISVREALLYGVKEEMWQLCGPTDLGSLDVNAPVQSVRFASRLTRDALIGAIPGDEPVWTSSGSFAGLLRLVPLESWAYHSGWAKSDLSTTTESS
jgi:hypothetical protein